MELSPAGHCGRKEVPVSPALQALSGYSSSTFTVADVNQKRTAAPREATSTRPGGERAGSCDSPQSRLCWEVSSQRTPLRLPACSLSVLADRELMQPKAVNRGFTANISYHDLA